MLRSMGMEPVAIAALILCTGALGMTIFVLVLARRLGAKLSSARLERTARELRTDTLILVLIGAAAAALYALLGDMTPRLAHALWLSAGIVGGGAFLIGALIWGLRRRLSR